MAQMDLTRTGAKRTREGHVMDESRGQETDSESSREVFMLLVRKGFAI